MDAKELNEILIGLGLLGIAAYFLWPKHAVPLDIQNPANDPVLEQLGGLAMPGLPGYLSTNRPAFAIAPEPFRPSPLGALGLGNPTTAPAVSPAFMEWPGAVQAGNAPDLPSPPPGKAADSLAGCCC